MWDHWQERCDVVGQVRRWRGTPYHHAQAVIGAGVDCARILIETYVEAGLIERFDPGFYPPDWFQHRDEERYLETIQRFAKREIAPEAAGPGDVICVRHGRTFSHGAVVTGDPRRAEPDGWPWVVHAFARAEVVEEIDARNSPLTMYPNGEPRPMRAFTLWGEP